MTKRSARDWWIFMCGGILVCFGVAPLGATFILAALALRTEDWMRSRDIFVHIKKRR